MATATMERKKRGQEKLHDTTPPPSPTAGLRLETPEQLLRVDEFERHPDNRIPRPEDVTLRAQSILDKGQIDAILARRRPGHDKLQILSGETRWRAHQLLGAVLIKARVIECSDREAIEYLAAANTERRDLTTSDRARLAAAMCAAGFKREEVAPKVGLTSGSAVSNLIKLVEAPECWLRALDEGIPFERGRRPIHEGTVREIAKFREVPDLAAKILEHFGDGPWFPSSRDQQINRIYQCVHDLTRSMTTPAWYGDRNGVSVCSHAKPRFKLDAAVREQLRIVTIPTHTGGTDEVALNVEEFDRLQWEALAKLYSRKSKGVGKSGKAGTDAGKKKQQEEQLANWCRQWKYWLLRCEIAERIEYTMAGWLVPWLVINAVRDHRCSAELLVHYAVDGYWNCEPEERKDEPLLDTLIRVERDATRRGKMTEAENRRDTLLRIAKIILWPADHKTRDSSLVAEGIPERLPYLRSEEIEAVAKSMEVTVEDAWQAGTVDDSAARGLIAQLLRRHTLEQLDALADEMGIKLHASGKAAMVSELLSQHKAGSPLPVPAVVGDGKGRKKRK